MHRTIGPSGTAWHRPLSRPAVPRRLDLDAAMAPPPDASFWPLMPNGAEANAGRADAGGIGPVTVCETDGHASRAV